MGKRARIVVAEDNPALRTAVRIILERHQCEVIGEARDGIEAVQLAAALRPDIVVLDRSMPRADGFEAAREISRWDEPPCMIMLSLDLPPYHVALGVQLGIRGFIRKKDVVDELPSALEEVCLGGTFFGVGAKQLTDPGQNPGNS
jgi:DNA-binding NarL/FixJ family response regulator